MNALDELASRAGIENEFVDAHGEKHVTGDETKRLFLRAMRLNAADDAAAAATLEALDRADWSSPLSPVCVSNVDRGPVAIDGFLDAADPISCRVEGIGDDPSADPAPSFARRLGNPAEP